MTILRIGLALASDIGVSGHARVSGYTREGNISDLFLVRHDQSWESGGIVFQPTISYAGKVPGGQVRMTSDLPMGRLGVSAVAAPETWTVDSVHGTIDQRGEGTASVRAALHDRVTIAGPFGVEPVEVKVIVRLRGSLSVEDWQNASSEIEFEVKANGLDALAIAEGRFKRGDSGDQNGRMDIEESYELSCLVDASKPWFELSAELEGVARNRGQMFFGDGLHLELLLPEGFSAVGTAGFLAEAPASQQRLVTVPRGLSGLANPLDRGGNTVAEVLPVVPEDTLLFFHDGCDFLINKFEFGEWTIPDLEFPPGRGALVYNEGEPFELRFNGEAPVVPGPPGIKPGWNLITSTGWTLNTLSPQEGDHMHRFLGDEDELVMSPSFEFGEWSVDPKLGPNEAFFYWRYGRTTDCDGEATAYFDNRVKAFGVDGAMLGGNGQPLTGPKWLAQLYGGVEINELVPIGTPVSYREGAGWGYVSTSLESVVKLPGIASGGTLYLELRSWNSAIGSTFEAAAANGGRHVASDVVQVSVGGIIAHDLYLPVFLYGLEPAQILSEGPELQVRLERNGGELALVISAYMTLPQRIVVEASADLVNWSEWNVIEGPGWEERISVAADPDRSQYFRCVPGW